MKGRSRRERERKREQQRTLVEREGGPEFWRCSLRWRVSYRGLGDPTLFSGLTPSLIFRSPPTTCNSPCLPTLSPRPVYPCRTYCRLSCLLRHSDSFSNGKHGTLPGVLRCCLARRPSSPLQNPLRSHQPSSTFNFV